VRGICKASRLRSGLPNLVAPGRRRATICRGSGVCAGPGPCSAPERGLFSKAGSSSGGLRRRRQPEPPERVGNPLFPRGIRPRLNVSLWGGRSTRGLALPPSPATPTTPRGARRGHSTSFLRLASLGRPIVARRRPAASTQTRRRRFTRLGRSTCSPVREEHGGFVFESRRRRTSNMLGSRLSVKGERPRLEIYEARRWGGRASPTWRGPGRRRLAGPLASTGVGNGWSRERSGG
jgi:hypothetical protein